MNKTVIITGASRGIGREIAKLFAKNNFNVVINYNKSKSEAFSLLDEIIAKNGCAITAKADITNRNEVDEMVNLTIEKFGKIDVLINNAGIAPKQEIFSDTTPEKWQKVFDSDVFGFFNCTQSVIPYMIHEKYGKIINMSSIWGVVGASCEVLYSSAKSAVIGFTKSLAKELAPCGINVNAIAPGMVDTDMNSHLSSDDVEEIRNEIPLMRISKPSEVAELALFLGLDKSSYITGQVIKIDGGWSE